ncbi:MAG TPA: Rrf2 family transcriptional regulator [Flavisolibacter sp.]|nr:Rrf2 family transcriptional regulator [Flavisolibacter sp.]
MLSTSCKYALRAAVYLMSQAGKMRKAGIREIADEIEANEHTTGKILQLLAKEEIIASAKGPNGGFYIPPGARPVFLIDIIKVVDGVDAFFECGLGLKKCSEKQPCPIHFTFKAAREKLYHEFCSLSIQDLAKDIEKGKAYLRR